MVCTTGTPLVAREELLLFLLVVGRFLFRWLPLGVISIAIVVVAVSVVSAIRLRTLNELVGSLDELTCPTNGSIDRSDFSIGLISLGFQR